MALNIKNERVHQLAREVAALRGTSQTSALEAALEEYLERHAAERPSEDERWGKVTALVDQIRIDLQGTGSGSLRDDLADLYDDHGLPR
ncbi:type II toxin-antitoxin system VapB family antitoxin [Kytococcus sedentarius]|uniref:type II toxin-antitoxin system VapB family antitoxin n=1 Tax=Kytococcus sedentarius TaxID=1276 RepID=UPI0035BC2A5E